MDTAIFHIGNLPFSVRFAAYVKSMYLIRMPSRIHSIKYIVGNGNIVHTFTADFLHIKCSEKKATNMAEEEG